MNDSTLQMQFATDKHFYQLADFIPQIVWTAQPDGYVDYYNKQWYSFTGFDKSYGDQSWIPILHPDDVKLCIDTWEEAIRTGSEYEMEYRFIDRKNPGSYRWFLGRACPIKDDEGQIVKWFGTCTEIDEQKRQEELLEQRVLERTKALKKLTVELQRSNQNLQQFAYVASHDLQEPLRKIQSFGDILINQYSAELATNGIGIIHRMQVAATRMSALIRDLLTYSRLSGQVDPFVTVSLEQIVSEVTSDLELAIHKAEATVLIESLPVVQGSPLQLRQLFQNLLSNALKFRKTTVPPRVRVSSRKVTGSDISSDSVSPIGEMLHYADAATDAQQFWEISVADNGIGFDRKYTSRIFQVFERLHGKDKYDGTGIGLAICQKVVMIHDGSITVRSQPDNGSTFLIYLPV
ncbi:sensor histidine kinase [Spirosoma spitsbergense]|jgi:PAS domain S-box-containing protein|uniref:sensor histidine kinase n=1 Tax=Spirosoma spitsbergense TaxID=431554 RepID=UPI000366EB01|nr:PAS domain-containing sensor histidine kinase [Spirosoma spitsbergense]